MNGTLKLQPENLAVESFTTAVVPPPIPEQVLTCLNTNCGNKLCCA